MYTTSLKTWTRAVAVDSILIAALVAGVIYHIPYALEVSVFFMWWISVLGIILGLLLALMPVLEKLWSTELVNRLAVSRTFLAYHWITDIVVWSLLVIAGHPILATFKVASFLISCILIGVAREKYRERLGIKSPDDIEKELAEHRAHLHKTNP